MSSEFHGMDAFLRQVQGSVVADIQEKVDFGIKRFAKALKKAGAKHSHTQLMDVMCQSLGLQSWASVCETLRGTDQGAVVALMPTLRPVFEVPLAPYERPNPTLTAQLRSLAPALAHLSGLSEEVVLDKVIAYVHEAETFHQLTQRDPCLHGPMYVTSEEDDGEDGENVLLSTPICRAAQATLAADARTLKAEPEKFKARLQSVVQSNQQCIKAWAYLCSIEQSTEAYLGAAEAMLTLLDEEEPTVLAPDVEGEFFPLATSTVVHLCAHGYEEDAYNLAMWMDDLSDQTTVFRYLVAACATAPHLVTGHLLDALDGDLAERVRHLDLDALLLLGLLYLADGDTAKRQGVVFVLRACMVAGGELRSALNGDFEAFKREATFHEDEEASRDSAEFTSALIAMARAANRQVVDEALSLLNDPRVVDELAAVAGLYDTTVRIAEYALVMRAEALSAYEAEVFLKSTALADKLLADGPATPADSVLH